MAKIIFKTEDGRTEVDSDIVPTVGSEVKVFVKDTSIEGIVLSISYNYEEKEYIDYNTKVDYSLTSYPKKRKTDVTVCVYIQKN